jgi:hypothetical protein
MTEQKMTDVTEREDEQDAQTEKAVQTAMCRLLDNHVWERGTTGKGTTCKHCGKRYTRTVEDLIDDEYKTWEIQEDPLYREDMAKRAALYETTMTECDEQQALEQQELEREYERELERELERQ